MKHLKMQAVFFVLAYCMGIIVHKLRILFPKITDFIIGHPGFMKTYNKLPNETIHKFEKNYKHVFGGEMEKEISSNKKEHENSFETRVFRPVDKYVQISGEWNTIEGIRLMRFFSENMIVVFAWLILLGAISLSYLVITCNINNINLQQNYYWPIAICMVILLGLRWYLPELFLMYIRSTIQHFNVIIDKSNFEHHSQKTK